MSEIEEAPGPPGPSRKPWALTFGVLAGPIAWAVNFSLIYMATPHLCGADWLPWLYVVGLAALGCVGLALWLSRREWRRVQGQQHVADENRHERRHTMALAGLGMSGFFLIVIVVQNLPLFLLDPCRR